MTCRSILFGLGWSLHSLQDVKAATHSPALIVLQMKRVCPLCNVLELFLDFLMQKENTPVLGMHRSKSKHELKLLEKIPDNAEATVVLVGKLSSAVTLSMLEYLILTGCFR